jgi:hypothetical protein
MKKNAVSCTVLVVSLSGIDGAVDKIKAVLFT